MAKNFTQNIMENSKDEVMPTNSNGNSGSILKSQPPAWITELPEIDRSKLAPITPSRELWQPPEVVPATILKIFPNEASIDKLIEIFSADGLTQCTEDRDRVRGMVNQIRQERYMIWKSGFYDRNPEWLVRDTDFDTAELQ